MDLSFKYEQAPKGCGRLSKVIEDAKQKQADDAKLRLARIANGTHPDYPKGGRCAGK